MTLNPLFKLFHFHSNLTTVTSTRFYQILLYKYFSYDFWFWEAFALQLQIVLFFHADIYWILEFVIDLTIVFELQKTGQEHSDHSVDCSGVCHHAENDLIHGEMFATAP